MFNCAVIVLSVRIILLLPEIIVCSCTLLCIANYCALFTYVYILYSKS